MKRKVIIFTGGGTGGHVYPAYPIIKCLLDQGFDIFWIGSRNGIEKRIVEGWKLNYYPIATGKLRRYFSFRNFTDIFRIAFGLIQSIILISKLKPVLVFSKGGFVSVPPVIASWILHIPSYTHDSDVAPGLATRINHRMTKKTFLAYDESRTLLGGNKEKVVISGNPVRSEFYGNNETLSVEWMTRLGNFPLLLVLGGSSGAKQINELIKGCLNDICSHYVVIHQMGDELYEQNISQTNYFPVPYLNEDLPSLLQRANIAVTRAGAGTLWELAVTGTPGILIPLRSGSRGDQIQNAEIFKNRGMALVIEDKMPTPSQLKNLILFLKDDEAKRVWMSKNCLNFIKNNAEDIIMSYLEKEL